MSVKLVLTEKLNWKPVGNLETGSKILNRYSTVIKLLVVSLE